MKIHLTGASGFVGQHVVREATRRGHVVVALVRERKASLEGTQQIEVGDIVTRTDWAEAVEGADVVVHLAARVHMMNESGGDLDAQYGQVNAAPTARLAEAARRAGVKRFVFMSSIKVNGERTSGPPITGDSLPAPVDPYGRSKLRAEQELKRLAEDTGLAVSVLRPTVVYGAGAGGNIARIAHAVQRGIPLPLGSVRNARTMLAVENLAQGTLAAVESDREGFGVYILGDPEPISTRSLVELLGRGVGVAPRLLRVPVGMLKLAGRLTGRSSDIARLVEDLEVAPQWCELGLDPAQLLRTEQGMVALGQALRSASPGGQN